MSSKNVARRIFSKLSESYDRIVMLMTFYQDRVWKATLLRHAHASKDAKIADIGSGTGLLEAYLTGQELVCGIDISLEMLLIAAEKRFFYLELVLGDAEKLPLRQNAFDSVLSCYAIKYCNTFAFIQEANRILKNGGLLGLYDFSKPSGSLMPLHALYAYGIMKLIGYFMQLLRKEVAYTFLNLPNVIIHSDWEEQVEEAMKRCDFRNIMGRVKLGARLYWAEKS